ncbi:hypothetical protein GF377_08990 [candidate division GN15 bacterium]|nr:hypothetical protein [candidate division GN15 bacterium]
MFCAFCGEEIVGKPVKQSGELYCSLECANRASGIDEEEEEGYFEEDPVDDFYEEED